MENEIYSFYAMKTYYNLGSHKYMHHFDIFLLQLWVKKRKIAEVTATAAAPASSRTLHLVLASASVLPVALRLLRLVFFTIKLA